MLAMAREYAISSGLGGPVADHRIQAAGITSLIKGILMLKHNLIPSHPGITQLNRHFPPLSKKNIRIPQSSVPFLPNTKYGKRRILINNFNATVS